MQLDYISVCYGNIKNIGAVVIFIVCAFHFFILIVSLVFYMLLMADPSNARCCQFWKMEEEEK